MIQFPKNFLWGAATSAYQVEGNNSNSDWWVWEKEAGKEQSGRACRHYELYEQDFDLAKDLNHNAHRCSIEWARIEPQEGNFSDVELQHYIKVVLALKARGIEPVVTLHHFTNPIWMSAQGGWTNSKSVELFIRYCDFVTRGLAPYVRYWTTINEPTIYFSHAFMFGMWPPQAKSLVQAKAVHDHMVRAHIAVYRRIKDIYKELNCPAPMISIAQHMQAYVPCTARVRDRLAAYLRNKYYNFEFIDQLMRARTLDFVGLNYYSRQLVDLKHWGLNSLATAVCSNNHDPVRKNSLGWDIYPQGLEMLLLKLKALNLPVLITENGICTGDDQVRWDFLRVHLASVHKAMEQGVPVMGYLYWSLLDNFEWAQGFAPRFGLIEVDYQTFKRTVRASAVKYGEICRTGVLDE